MTLNYKNCFLVSFFLLGLNYLICNSPIKKWWVDSNGEIKTRGFEADKSILDTMYYIEFSEGIPKYKGPVGYQGGPFLGGLNQEQYFIPNSKNFGKVIKSYPIK